MKPRESIKVGTIGCGRLAVTSRLPSFRHLSDLDVIAIADIDPSRLHKVADRFHIRRRCTNYPALLEDPTVEAVAVCVAPWSHLEVASAALDAGTHASLEKPVALSLEETDQLITCAQPSSRKLMLGFNLRWHRLAQHASTMVQQGNLGPLESVRSEITSYHETIPEWMKRDASEAGRFLNKRCVISTTHVSYCRVKSKKSSPPRARGSGRMKLQQRRHAWRTESLLWLASQRIRATETRKKSLDGTLLCTFLFIDSIVSHVLRQGAVRTAFGADCARWCMCCKSCHKDS